MKKLILFPILFIAIAVHAQTISNYLSPPYPTNLTSSKSGSTIAWVFNDKGSRNVYTAGADGNNVTRITNYSGDDGMEIADVQITSGQNKLCMYGAMHQTAVAKQLIPLFFKHLQNV